MLKISKWLNESEPAVQEKNNIVILQCLFRNLLTDKQMDFSSDVVSKGMRRGLDFELYYQVDGNTMRELLGTTLLATNCVNGESLAGNRQIVQILSKFEPFACFLTDSKGERITDDTLSEKSCGILRQRNAQSGNFSIYRFSFFHSGYATATACLFAGQDGAVIQDGYVVRISNGKPTSVVLDSGNGEAVPVEALTRLTPFMLSGYWNRIVFYPADGSFTRDDTVRAPFIPALKMRWKNNVLGMFKSIVRSVSDISWDGFKSFMTLAMSKAIMSGNDMRTKNQERTAPVRRPRQKIVKRFMREEERQVKNEIK